MSTLVKFMLLTITWPQGTSFVGQNQYLPRYPTTLWSDLHRASKVEEGLDDSHWGHYQTSSLPLQHSFEKAGGILYRTSVLSSEECTDISREITSLSRSLSEETTSSVAKKRIGAPLTTKSKTFEILENGSLRQLVHRVVGQDYELATDISVEVRVYEKVGAGMEWHVDDVLYDPPQVEVVYTLENNSDCVTVWREIPDELKTIETDANSALLLRAGGVSHCVSSLKHGRRVILKCAFVAKGAKKVEQHVEQFAAVTKKAKRRGKR